MAAGLSSKNIFTSPSRDKLKAYQVKMSWSEGSFSDPITILYAYQKFKSLEQAEYFKRSGGTPYNQKKRWANDNFIELKALKVKNICLLMKFSPLLSMFLFLEGNG